MFDWCYCDACLAVACVGAYAGFVIEVGGDEIIADIFNGLLYDSVCVYIPFLYVFCKCLYVSVCVLHDCVYVFCKFCYMILYVFYMISCVLCKCV